MEFDEQPSTCSIWKYTELGNVVNVVVAQRETTLSLMRACGKSCVPLINIL